MNEFSKQKAGFLYTKALKIFKNLRPEEARLGPTGRDFRPGPARPEAKPGPARPGPARPVCTSNLNYICLFILTDFSSQ